MPARQVTIATRNGPRAGGGLPAGGTTAVGVGPPGVAAESPREGSRSALERYLRARVPADAALRVALLGVEDLLWSEPPARWPGSAAGDAVDVLPVYLHDQSVLVGPVGPARHQSPPCFHCVARRWQHLRPEQERDCLELGWPVVAAGPVPYLTDFALEAVWRTAQHLLDARPGTAPADPGGHPYVYAVSLATLRVRRYPLIADPDCPVCARKVPDVPERALVEFVPRPKPDGGGSRLRRVRDYGLCVEAYLNPVCGALGSRTGLKLASTTSAPAIGYVAIRGPEYLHNSFWGGHTDSYADSVRTGVLEGLERHAGVRPRRTRTAVFDSYENLRPDALDPRECGLYPPEFYADGNDTFVPFTPRLAMPWVWGYSLRDAKPVLVPESSVYYHLPHTEGRFVRECSSGCAAGSCLEEAVLHGLLELVERDAFLLCWYGGRGMPELDPESCADVHTRFMTDRISLCGYRIRLFDTRIDLPIPVVTAVAVRRDGGLGTLCVGAGAGMDPEDAIHSAVYETALVLPDFAEQTAWGRAGLREMAADFWKVRMLQNHQRLFGLPEMARHCEFLLGPRPAVRRDPAPLATAYRDWYRRRPDTGDLLDDLRFCLDQVTGAGFDVIVVDQTSPEQAEIGLRTVRVIAPGLLPIDFGWSRQRALRMPRLRTAFRRAGWRDTDLDVSELNFVPHPFP